MENDHENIKICERAVGSLVGLACGDAVGTTLEFKPRGTFTPIDDMVGGGPFNLQAGQWTDDMSMALCLGHSLLHQKDFNPEDQMNRYSNWQQVGYMSSTGECFDIGNTVASALRRYRETKNPWSGSTDPHSAGNGSIMRLAPIPIFYNMDIKQCLRYAAESSRTTHGAEECVEACQLFASLIFYAFHAEEKDTIFEHLAYWPSSPGLSDIASGKVLDLDYTQIKGTGYVVDSLRAAVWCFWQGNSFRECILLAANLGDDADTTAAICGQLAGAFYGVEGIPEEWRKKITMSEDIHTLARDLFMAGRENYDKALFDLLPC